MTTTMKKRMLALAAMMMLLVAMAVPAFAAGNSTAAIGNPTIVNYREYRFYANGNSNYLLNVYGNGNTNDNVTLYRPTNGNDQIWITVPVVQTGEPGYGYFVVSALAQKQSLNIYHATGNCQLHSWSGNTTDGKSDSAVTFENGSRAIRLSQWPNMYLGFASAVNNANVKWFDSTRSAWEWAIVN